MTSTDLDSTDIEARARVLATIGEPVRLQILEALSDGPLCVCDILEHVGIAANLLSYHLRVLRDVGLVEAQRRGRWMDYDMAPDARDRMLSALPTGVGLEVRA